EGTDLWKEIVEGNLYADYDLTTRKIEALATAIGREGAIYQQQAWWKAWWNRMVNKLKEILGIERNIAQQLAQEILEADFRPVNTSQFIFDRTLHHRDKAKFERAKQIGRELLVSLENQISSIRELSENPKIAERSRKNLQARMKKRIEEEYNIYEQVVSIQDFVEEANEQLVSISQTIEALRYGDIDKLMRKAGEMLQVIEDYKILDDLKRDSGDLIEEYANDSSVTMSLLQKTMDLRDDAKQGINDIVIPKMAELLSTKASPETVETVGEMIESVKKGNILNLNRIKKTTEYKRIESENIPDNEKQEKIKQLAIRELKRRMATPNDLETFLRRGINGDRYFLHLVDPIIYSNDDAIQLFTLLIKDRLAESRMKTIRWRNNLETLHKDFFQETGREGWDNEKIYEFMLEDINTDSDKGVLLRKSFIQPYDVNRYYENRRKLFDKLNKKYIGEITDGRTFGEAFIDWKRDNPQEWSEYKKEISLWHQDNSAPIEGWEKLVNDNWNKLHQAINDKSKIEQKENLSEKDQQDFQSIQQQINELERWFEENLADYTLATGAKPEIPIRELTRPAIGNEGTVDYTNKKYEKIQDSPILKKYYDKFLTVFQELQDVYGSYHFDRNRWDEYSYYVPSVRKNQKDRLIENGIKDSLNEFKESFKVLDTDDVYGQYVNQRKKIPIYYSNAVDSKDTSNDIPSVLMLFAQQAMKYDELTDLLGHVHVMRNILENREIAKVDSRGNQLFDSVSKRFGFAKELNEDISPSSSKQYKQWTDWIDTVFYGITSEEQKILNTDIELNKLMNNINTYAAFNVFPFNFLQGIANVLNGNNYILQEAIAGEFFTKKDYLTAQKNYLSASLGLLGDMGLTSPKSKLGQLMEIFDVQEGVFMKDVASNVFNTRLKNLTTTEQAFFIQSSGELQMAVTPFLAIMNNKKVKDSNGKEISLYDAYEIGTDGKIKLKKGINLSSEERNRITNRVNGLNRSMQGIYDQFNAPWLKKRWYGKPLLLFRSWLLPTYRRFWGYNTGDFRYDHEIGSVREGIYQTALRFFKNMLTETSKFDLDNYRNMTSFEKANMKRFVSHMATLVLTMGTVIALKASMDDDDEMDKSSYYALYWAARLRSEMAFFLAPQEAVKLLRSPAASMTVIEKASRFGFYLLNAPIDLMLDGELEQYQRRVGTFEAGTPKLYKAFRNMIPGINAFDNSMSPEEAYKWYTGLF
ncbi:MAG: hypothetical protein WD512_05990, partial [Candidatus Paceibacterota bacterium]